MARPLMQNGIAQLEAMFASSGLDAKVLKQLEGELKHRQVPRAVNLLAEVQAALRKVPKAEAATQPTEPARGISRPVAPPPRSQTEQGNVTAPARLVAPSPMRAEPFPALSIAPADTKSSLTLSAEAAYQLYKATPTTPWETVENLRRQLVDAAHPAQLAALAPEKRAQVREAASRANAAYALLHSLRTAASN
jgi:DnaJ-domain-containing protein 1